MYHRDPFSSQGSRTVVIVGAGFCGTVVAINLLRLAGSQALRIVLLDRAEIGRGVAYARRDFPYRLNVPAARMSASSLDSDDFLNFARRSWPQAGAADFLRRDLYGDYLQWTLAAAERSAPAHVQLHRLRGSASALERDARSARLQVLLSDGRSIAGDAVVLAVGNPAPAPLAAAQALPAAAPYASDPWRGSLRVRAGETLLVVGTGLTMADVVTAAAERTRGKLQIHAISRHGLLPPPQSDFHAAAEDLEPRLRVAAPSLRLLFRTVRSLAEEAQLRDGDWRAVITQVRTLAPYLWEQLPPAERRRFLRHVRSYWDVHRHRLPDDSWQALNDLRRAGRLQVHAGRIEALQVRGRRIHVEWRPRGACAPGGLLVDRVVNCTGPDHDVSRSGQPLLRSLLAQGMARRDPLGLGLLVDERGALLDARGRGTAGGVFYVGPMLRAQRWEATAVQELRGYAERLAAHLLVSAPLAASVTSSSPSEGISTVRVLPASRGRTLGGGSVAAARSAASSRWVG